MRWFNKKKEPEIDHRQWQPWFAWRPVKSKSKHWMFWETVLWCEELGRDSYGGSIWINAYREHASPIPLVKPEGNLYDHWEPYDKHFPHRVELQLDDATKREALDWLDKFLEVNEDYTLIQEEGVHKPFWAFVDSKVALQFKLRFT